MSARSRVDRTIRAATAATTLATLILLSGCAGRGSQDAAVEEPQPPLLTANLYQTRMDVNDRQIQVKVRNLEDHDVVIQRMRLTSTGYTGTMTYRKSDSLLRAGTAVDMPVLLTEPVCHKPLDRHTVEVDYQVVEGATGTMQIAATDEDAVIEALHARECFAVAVSDVASIELEGLPEITGDDVLVAGLTVKVTGSGKPGDLRIVHAGSTTLLQHADPATGKPLPGGASIDVTAPQSGTATFDLTLVPNRCDAHAIAEDKQGTRFPLLVRLGGQEGLVPLVSPPPVTTALYDFVRTACQQ